MERLRETHKDALAENLDKQTSKMVAATRFAALAALLGVAVPFFQFLNAIGLFDSGPSTGWRAVTFWAAVSSASLLVFSVGYSISPRLLDWAEQGRVRMIWTTVTLGVIAMIASAATFSETIRSVMQGVSG